MRGLLQARTAALTRQGLGIRRRTPCAPWRRPPHGPKRKEIEGIRPLPRANPVFGEAQRTWQGARSVAAMPRQRGEHETRSFDVSDVPRSFDRHSGAGGGAGPDQSDRSTADLHHVSRQLHSLGRTRALHGEGHRGKADRPAGPRHRYRQGARRHRHGSSRQARQAGAEFSGRT
jgi:hypothetical protein